MSEVEFYKETEFRDSVIGINSADWEIKTLLDTVGGKDDLVVAGPFGSNLKVADYRDEGVPIIRLQNIERGKFVNKDIKYISFEKAEELSYHSFVKGDVVLAKLGDPIGKTCIVPDFLEKGIVVADVVRMRIDEKKVDKRYIMQVLNSKIVSSQLRKGVIGTTRPRVNLDQVRDLLVPVPQISEQHATAEVLYCVDLTIQKTDEVIAKTERLKKGLMQQLLTKGIGHKEFKDTPIGKMPTVWEIMSLGDVAAELGSGLTPFGGSRTYLEHGIPLIRSQNVQMNKLDFADIVYISQETHRDMKRSTVFPGDLLLNITGASIGRVAVVPESVTEANVNQHVCRIRFSERMDSEFASFYLSSPKGQQQILSSQAGATRQGLNYQQAKLIQLPCPSLDEQREIINILSTTVRKLELEEKNRRKMERIKQCLMDLLLTGKVRIKVD